MRLLLLLISFFNVVCFSPLVHAEQRLALIVTNQDYPASVGRLGNTHSDGLAVAVALERVGFDVRIIRDVDKAAFAYAISEFVDRLAKAGPDAISFFYYSGHGAAESKHGDNFLIPVNTPLSAAEQLPLMAVKLGEIVDSLSSNNNKANFVVIDACRNVPIRRRIKSAHKGFTAEKERGGVLIAYATEPGNVAVDEGIYAKALAAEIEKPDQAAVLMFRSVRRRVLNATNSQQFPWTRDGLVREFYFGGRTKSPTAISATNKLTDEDRDGELALWSSIGDSRDPKNLKGYLDQYPEGTFKELALLRLETLEVGASGKGLSGNTKDLARTLQQELKRVGCDPGPIDGEWGSKSREALNKFVIHSGLKFEITRPSEIALLKVRSKRRNVCPKTSTGLSSKTTSYTNSKAARSTPKKRCRRETLSECRARWAGTRLGYTGTRCPPSKRRLVCN